MPHSQHGMKKEVIQQVWDRAQNKCEECFATGKLEVHHIITRGRARKWKWKNDLVNLALLCTECHANTHCRTGELSEKWLRRKPPKECTQCEGSWEALSEERIIRCSECLFEWPY